VAAARNAVDVDFGVGSNGKGNGLKGTHAIAQRIKAFWQSLGGSVAHPVDTNCFGSIIDLKKAGTDSQTLRKGARKRGVKLTSGRMVVEWW
jgi:threonine aldolase